MVSTTQLFSTTQPNDRMLTAIATLNAEDLRQALADGADPNANRSGNPPILQATRTGRLDLVQALLDAGAEANTPNAHGWRSIHEAAQSGYEQIVQALVDRPMTLLSLPARNGLPPLHLAAAAGHRSVLRVLLEAGVPVDLPSSTGATPLMLAIEKQNESAMHDLLEEGADPFALDRSGHGCYARAASWPLGLTELARRGVGAASHPVLAILESAPSQPSDPPETSLAGVGVIRKRLPR